MAVADLHAITGSANFGVFRQVKHRHGPTPFALGIYALADLKLFANRRALLRAKCHDQGVGMTAEPATDPIPTVDHLGGRRLATLRKLNRILEFFSAVNNGEQPKDDAEDDRIDFFSFAAHVRARQRGTGSQGCCRGIKPDACQISALLMLTLSMEKLQAPKKLQDPKRPNKQASTARRIEARCLK